MKPDQPRSQCAVCDCRKSDIYYRTNQQSDDTEAPQVSACFSAGIPVDFNQMSDR